MKNLYFLISVFCCLFTVSTFAQDEIIYEAIDNGSGVALGVAFTTAANGPNTFTGDAVQVEGTARIVTQITVASFVTTDTTFIPGDFTVRLYTSCPVSNPGNAGLCGANNAGTLIEGSEVTMRLTTPPTAANPITIAMPNVDISSETDDTIYVVFNSERDNINGVLNGIATTGADGMEDVTEVNSFVSCGTASASNCARRLIGAVSNNFIISISATTVLDLDKNNLEKGISVFPNPITSEATIAFQDFFNPTQAKIFDINGKQVSQKYTYNLENNFKMDMSGLSSGVYFLHFESEEGTVVKQLIKQ